jgi:flagellin-specific chaperone FliS
MMNVVSFNLLENGVDSIIEGMNYFISDSKTSRKYKFALLLVAHGVELILKERLARINDILIYANIDKLDRLDRNDTESLPTVSLLDAIERLKHAKVAIDPKWVMVCRRMQKKRNEIQHLRVSLDIDEAKNIVGETIDFLIPFMRDELGKDLEQLVSDSPGIKDAIADVRHHFNLHFREAYNKMRAEEKRLNEKQIDIESIGAQTVRGSWFLSLGRFQIPLRSVTTAIMCIKYIFVTSANVIALIPK